MAEPVYDSDRTLGRPARHRLPLLLDQLDPPVLRPPLLGAIRGQRRDRPGTLGLETAAFEGVRKVVRKALDMGFTETDYSSLYNAVVPEDPEKKPG